MPIEIKNIHSALRLELASLVAQFGDLIHNKKVKEHKSYQIQKGKCVGEISSETASTDSNADINMMREDYLIFIAVLLSHSDSEDALIFPVLTSRTADAKERLAALDSQHNHISSLINAIKSQLDILPVVSSETARWCIIEDILAQSLVFQSIFEAHLESEERSLHPLMMDHMNTDEMNVIVGRVLGHRSSEMMENILKLLYRHLSPADFAICLDNIQKSVSGTFFKKWLTALPQHAQNTVLDNETTVSSIFEAGSVESENGISFQNNSTVAGVMSGSIPGPLRGYAIEHLQRDYEDPVQYSLEEVIRQENARLLSKNNKRKRKVNLSQLKVPKRRPPEIKASVSSAETTVPMLELSDMDLCKSYFNKDSAILGCDHYKKKCKIIAPCCSRVFVCRLCHNDTVDDGHVVDRYSIKSIVCMECGTQQPVSNLCINSNCRTVFARYFCKICNFYNDSEEPVYHCPYCNVCRRGSGIGLVSEFFHCMTCNACVRNMPGVVHKCLSHSMERMCPICLSYLFDSVDKLKGLSCGHVMHLTCFTEYEKRAHTCPICRIPLDEESVPKNVIDTR